MGPRALEEKARAPFPPAWPTPLDQSIKHLIARLGRENARWGYLRIRGGLLKLGIDVSATTIATVLRRSGLGPAPRRIGPTWGQFLRLQAYALLSPGSRFDAEDSFEDLGRGRHRDAPVPSSEVPNRDELAATCHGERIYDRAPRRSGWRIATVVVRPRATVAPVPPDGGTVGS